MLTLSPEDPGSKDEKERVDGEAPGEPGAPWRWAGYRTSRLPWSPGAPTLIPDPDLRRQGSKARACWVRRVVPRPR